MTEFVTDVLGLPDADDTLSRFFGVGPDHTAEFASLLPPAWNVERRSCIATVRAVVCIDGDLYDVCRSIPEMEIEYLGVKEACRFVTRAMYDHAAAQHAEQKAPTADTG